jgi:hypothetical protein
VKRPEKRIFLVSIKSITQAPSLPFGDADNDQLTLNERVKRTPFTIRAFKAHDNRLPFPLKSFCFGQKIECV